jgi:hypothetical protein
MVIERKDGNSSSDISAAVSQVIDAKLGAIGPSEEKVYMVPIGTSSLMEYLAGEIHDLMAFHFEHDRNFTLTEEDVCDSLSYLVAAKAWFSAGGMSEERPRDLEYPAFINPVLAQVGWYKDELANRKLVPIPEEKYLLPGSLIKDEEGNVVGIDKRKRMPKLEVLPKVTAALSTLGTPIAYGLPKDKYVDNDDLFRLDVVGEVLHGNSGKLPSVGLAMARVLVSMQYLNSVYGEAGVSYQLAASHLKTPLRTFVQTLVPGRPIRISGNTV